MISFRRGYHINRFLYTSRILQTALTVRAANPRKRRSQANPRSQVNPRTHPPINSPSPPKPPPTELLTLALPSKKYGQEELSDDHLSRLLDSALKSHPTTELAILYLMRRYQFDLGNINEMLLARSLDVSFSRFKYVDIAQYVGLNPLSGFRDAPTFDVDRARIPTPLFKLIVEDMHLALNQYGPPREHHGEEARSRFTAPIMNRLVAQLNLLIKNTPESIMQGRITTKGRVEYQFKVCGALTILFVEVKIQLDGDDDQLNAIAQVIAEADACDSMNNRKNHHAPLYAILHNGYKFDFFVFDGQTKPPKFSRGLFLTPDGSKTDNLWLPFYQKSRRVRFIKALRPICEHFYAILLRGYIAGLGLYYANSQPEAGESDKSALAWAEAVVLGRKALKKGLEAAEMARGVGTEKEANDLAAEGFEMLKKSVNSVPPPEKRDDCDLMEVWDDSF